MREFFSGWRRKAGFVALVMALAVMGMWIRSLFYQDALLVVGKLTTMIASANGSISWTIEEADDETAYAKAWHWINRPITSDNGNEVHATEVLGMPKYVQYAPIVIILTLLSAYLILWQPRKRPGPDNA